jgi:hypothetical protein
MFYRRNFCFINLSYSINPQKNPQHLYRGVCSLYGFFWESQNPRTNSTLWGGTKIHKVL